AQTVNGPFGFGSGGGSITGFGGGSVGGVVGGFGSSGTVAPTLFIGAIYEVRPRGRTLPVSVACRIPVGVGGGVVGRCLEITELLFRAVLREAVALLQLAHQLLAVAFDLIDVAVRQLAPLVLDLAFDLVPLAFQGIAVHVVLLEWSCNDLMGATPRPRICRRAVHESARPHSDA